MSNRRFLLLVVLRAWFSSQRFRFSDSSWLSFPELCSSCLECSLSFSFKLWTYEESSGFSVTYIRALFSSVTWLWMPLSCLWSSASLGDLCEYHGKMDKACIRIDSQVIRRIRNPLNNNDYLGSARFLLPFLIIQGHPELRAIARDIALAVGLVTGPGRGSPYRKFSFPGGRAWSLGPGPRILSSGDSGRILAGTQRPEEIVCSISHLKNVCNVLFGYVQCMSIHCSCIGIWLSIDDGMLMSIDGWLALEDGNGDAAFGNGHLLFIEAGYVNSQGLCPVLEDFVEAIRGFLQVPAAGELFYELVTENSKGGYGPGGQECYIEHPLYVLGDMVVRIAGAVIRIYVGKGELPGHLDQGDLIRERSVSIRVSNHRRLRFCCSLGCFLIGFRLLFAVFYVAASPCDVVGGRFTPVPEFSDSSWLSFPALCSSCLECSLSFSFKLWTYEESSGFSVTYIRDLFSSVTWLWMPLSCLWSSASLGDLCEYHGKMDKACIRIDSQVIRRIQNTMKNNDYLGSARFLLPFLIIKGHPELRAIARDIALAIGLVTGPGRGALATRLKEEERWRSVDRLP
ncbi:hypothetical protein F2Q69_00052271 [Brassica cretica]|uniref:Uncharacterized protein n=1 Tax=Brassica cretica TaxID=69181 RepID=A0A8S9N3Z0_BRACR|nr:hypothetical protein F2Q69_00052271 [Brassica cretica]